MAKQKYGAFKNIIVLFVVALISVSILAVLNQVTAEPIATAEANAKAAVYMNVYSDAADVVEIEDFDALLSGYTAANSDITINTALKAVDESGNTIGYVVDATSPNAYGGDIQIAIGITNDGEITAFSVIKANETPGLGAKSLEDEFASQFSGLSASEITFSKTGANHDNNEIDAISGATITTRAITEAVNEAISFYNSSLKGV